MTWRDFSDGGEWNGNSKRKLILISFIVIVAFSSYFVVVLHKLSG